MKGEQQDIRNLVTVPCVQRSLCLDVAVNDHSKLQFNVSRRVSSRIRDMLERGMATTGKAARARAWILSRARKEASAQEVRQNYKQFAEATHHEHKSWVDSSWRLYVEGQSDLNSSVTRQHALESSKDENLEHC